MPLEFGCPQCQKPFSVASALAGKKARCNQCGLVFRIPEDQPPVRRAKPSPAADDLYGFAETPRSSPQDEPALPRRPRPEPSRPRRARGGSGVDERVVWGIGAVAVMVVLTVVIRILMRNSPNAARTDSPYFAAMLLFPVALFSLIACVLDWDWFFEHRKARLFVAILGRTGARVLYILIGGAAFGVGVELVLRSPPGGRAAAVDGVAQETATFAPDPSAPRQLPSPPLDLPQPAPPPQSYRGHDLSTVDGGQLGAAASTASREGRYADAAQLQYWSFAADDDGRYNLACYCALAGQKEAAFYWLQEAALKEGADGDWAGEDPDLESLRQDARWRVLKPFLKDCNRYWSASGLHSTTLVLPQGYTRGTPIGVVVGLHGMGGRPETFVGENAQSFADALNMAFVGVSGPVPRGPRSFVWSEDASRDAAQIQRALDEVADRVTVDKGQVVLYGFSQGGQMAFEVAFQFPDKFRGALVMSPGTRKTINLAGLTARAGNRNQGYVCTCGAGEHPGNVANTQEDAQHAQQSGARAELKLYAGVNVHTFPPDFEERFPGWVQFILGHDARTAPARSSPALHDAGGNVRTGPTRPSPPLHDTGGAAPSGPMRPVRPPRNVGPSARPRAPRPAPAPF